MRHTKYVNEGSVYRREKKKEFGSKRTKGEAKEEGEKLTGASFEC